MCSESLLANDNASGAVARSTKHIMKVQGIRATFPSDVDTGLLHHEHDWMYVDNASAGVENDIDIFSTTHTTPRDHCVIAESATEGLARLHILLFRSCYQKQRL